MMFLTGMGQSGSCRCNNLTSMTSAVLLAQIKQQHPVSQAQCNAPVLQSDSLASSLRKRFSQNVNKHIVSMKSRYVRFNSFILKLESYEEHPLQKAHVNI